MLCCRFYTCSILQGRVGRVPLRWSVRVHSSEVFPRAQQRFLVGVVESAHGDAECEKRAGHGDGRDDAHEEVRVVSLPDALVQPLAVVVEHVHALVADGAVFGTLQD